MRYSATVITDSISPEECGSVRLITVEACYPRFILPEVNTHRVFSRNGASSRAIPFKRIAEAIRENPAHPFKWLKNQPGMVATEAMDADLAAECQSIWFDAMEDALEHAQKLADRGASKQIVNRIVEPYVMTRTLISSTKWANFMKLRHHEAAAPEFEELARIIKLAIRASTPTVITAPKDYLIGLWHLPYVRDEERRVEDLAPHHDAIPDSVLDALDARDVPSDPVYRAMLPLLIMCAARCARLTTKSLDTGKESTFEEDLRTFTKLCSDPLHASPLEHPAIPVRPENDIPAITGNFHGWAQFRKMCPNEAAVDEASAFV